MILLTGLNKFEDCGKLENLQEDLSAIEEGLKIKTITALTSKTLVYRADMSLQQD